MKSARNGIKPKYRYPVAVTLLRVIITNNHVTFAFDCFTYVSQYYSEES